MGVWSEIKRQTRITDDDLLMPPTTEKIVKNAGNILPPSTVSFDIETGSVDDMWRADSRFLRLFGWGINDKPILTSEFPDELLTELKNNDSWIIGHNILNYDLILLDKFYGLSILELAKADRIRDTKLLAFLADPPLSRMKEGEIEKIYSLQNQGEKYLGVGKVLDIATGKSVLKELAKQYGGFDMIPTDNVQYDEYLKRDVEVTRDLAKAVPINDYAIREHKIAAIASTISIQGFRVDIDLLKQRIHDGEEKRHRILTGLMEYGLPGPDTTKAPHRTNAGIEAIDVAFKKLHVTLPRTPKSNTRPAMGKEILESVIASAETQEVADLAEAVMSLNGIRTIYANIEDNLVGDRVHPSINLRQSTGRWSIQNPGLTVVGKRGGKVREREVFLPDEGCILISCDLSQVDARAVAGLSQDTEYMKLFEAGRDMHTEMAVRLFGSEEYRERAKAASHGINYGMRAGKLALTTGMSELEAADFITGFEENFPVLADWQRKVRIVGETTGVLYNGFGRLMRIEPERSFTQSPALMGQSTARDILCEGILRLWDIGGDDIIRMIRGIIHDEAVLSVPVKDVEEVENLVVKALSFEWCPEDGKYPIQIIAGLNKRGRNWADSYRKD